MLYDLSGYFGGYSSQDDFAELHLAFSNGVTTTVPITIGQVTHTERGDLTSLLPRSAAGVVPPGTIRLIVTLDMVRVSPGVYNDGYADNLALVLRLKGLFLPLLQR